MCSETALNLTEGTTRVASRVDLQPNGSHRPAGSVSGYLDFGTLTIPPRPSFEIGLAETELVARKVAENASIRLLRNS
jgi:hypothetical protein